MIDIRCSDNIDMLRGMQDNSVDLVVTSPPYDNLRHYGGHAWNFEALASQLVRALKEGGVIVWVVGDSTINGSETLTSFRQAIHFKDVCGLNVHDTMLYLKAQMAFPESNRYYPAFEYMFVMSKGRPKTVNLIKDRENVSSGSKIHARQRQKDGSLLNASNYGEAIAKYGVRWNYWLMHNQTRGEHTTTHPATFPYELAYDHILSWSNEGDLVLDPFLGSGTTALAAKSLNRRFVGCDINQTYVDLAIKRASAIT